MNAENLPIDNMDLNYELPDRCTNHSFTIRKATKQDIEQIQNLFQLNHFSLVAIPPRHALLRRILLYPEGEMVATLDKSGLIVGYGSCVQVNEIGLSELILGIKDWDNLQVIKKGEPLVRRIFLTHPKASETLLAANFEKTFRKLAKHLKTSRLFTLARIPGFSSETIDLNTYLEQVELGKKYNRNIYLWQTQGYSIVQKLPHFRIGDLESKEAAALMQWTSPLNRIVRSFTEMTEPWYRENIFSLPFAQNNVVLEENDG